MTHKILIVEDYIVNQEVTKEMLNILNCDVIIADNGLIALEKCQASEFDLVFMDIQMPVMDGIEATIKIRKNEVENGKEPTPIIALTANALPGDKEKYLEAGMNDYVSKPMKIKDLELIIDKYLKN